MRDDGDEVVVLDNFTTGARRNLLAVDFGIGVLAEREPHEARITATAESLGTPAYAAPEQLRGLSPAPASDLYSWGLR